MSYHYLSKQPFFYTNKINLLVLIIKIESFLKEKKNQKFTVSMRKVTSGWRTSRDTLFHTQKPFVTFQNHVFAQS